MSSEFDENLVFDFSLNPPKEKGLRDACGNGIHGCFYKCRTEDIDLHPCCARLKAQVHSHNMVMDLRKKVSSKCLWCEKKKPPGNERGNPGWCYVSECKKLHETWQRGLRDGTGENSISNINFEHMSISDRNRGGRGTEVALKIIGILRIVVGILLGDPSVFFGKLVFEFHKQLL